MHTAVKPFVCKFCGKSSRLKGNLTKHILKHHKTEQRDYIGTDEYIIKKGKKSVKDPAAIEFLERSMIVLNNNNNLSCRNEEEAMADGQQDILLSLGLDRGSLDLKTESTVSEADETDFNEQLLFNKCESVTGGDESMGMRNEDFDESSMQPEATTDDFIQPGSSGQQQMADMDALAACKVLFGQIMDSDGGQLNSRTLFESCDRGATKVQAEATPGDDLLRLVASLGQSQQSAITTDDNGAEMGEQQQQNCVSASTGYRLATQCQKCGKHFRKPRDLIAHLSTAHKALPSQNNNNTGAASSPSSSAQSTEDFAPFNGGGRVKATSSNSKNSRKHSELAQELRQMREALVEMKNGNGNNNGIGRLEQLLGQLDSRVCRLEKQLEMALNSIYTLVQLQTGINNSVSKLSRSLQTNNSSNGNQ